MQGPFVLGVIGIVIAILVHHALGVACIIVALAWAGWLWFGRGTRA